MERVGLLLVVGMVVVVAANLNFSSCRELNDLEHVLRHAHGYHHQQFRSTSSTKKPPLSHKFLPTTAANSCDEQCYEDRECPDECLCVYEDRYERYGKCTPENLHLKAI